jgi:serine/threonine-protein kinase HipA
MTSEQPPNQAFVWVFLPGEIEPTLCGRFVNEETPVAGVGTFVYARSYLAHAHALPLDPVMLPLRTGAHRTTAQGGFFGVFINAAPDDWGRAVINLMHGKPKSPVGYLLRSLGDRVGNLDFSEAPDAAPTQRDIPGRDVLKPAVAVLDGIERGRQEDPALTAWIRPNTAMGGTRPKLTIADGKHQWLAKFPSRKDDPNVPVARLEHAMHALARKCGIETVDSEIVSVEGSDLLLVRRFDRMLIRRAGRAAGWSRDAFVSARTVLDSSPTNTYSFEGSYPGLARDLTRWSANPVADKHELFRRMVFNCLVSNTDDHDRNHGFLADELGAGYRMSPAYDMVPRIPTTARRFQAMQVGDNAEPTRDNILSHCASFDLSPGAAGAIHDEMLMTVRQNWRSCFDQSGLNEEAMEKYAACFQ